MDYHARMSQLRRQEGGPAKTAAVEYFVRQLEANNIDDLLPEALTELLECYTFFTPSPKTLAVMSRILRLFDTRPELFDPADTRNVYWVLKWVASDLYCYPEISIPSAEAFFADMSARYARGGYSQAAVDRAIAVYWEALGYPDRGADARRRWMAAPDDDPLDCADCKQSARMRYLLDDGRYEEILNYTAPSDGGCTREPATFHRIRAHALFHLGRFGEGRQDARAARYLQHYQLENAAIIGENLLLIAKGGESHSRFRTYLTEYDRTERLLDKPCDPFTRCNGLTDTIEALSVYGENFRITDFPYATSADELKEFLVARARELAAPLDARAGNTHLADRIDAAVAAPAWNPDRASAHPSAPPSPETRTSTAAGGSSDPEELVARADRAWSSKNFADAAHTYEDAAAGFATRHQLYEQALALANAGKAWAEVDSLANADRCFETACDRLRAVPTGTGLFVGILTEWANVASELGTFETLGELIRAAHARATTDWEADRRGRQTRFVLAQAQLLLGNYISRLLANAHTSELDLAGMFEATELLEAAAEGFYTTGDMLHAAQASFECGQCLRALRDIDRAAACYTMALKLVPDTRRQRILDAYVEMLVEAGRGADVEALMKKLSEGEL